MRTLIRGRIVDFIPSFNASLDENGTLVLSENGELSFTVDTGFDGGIALPEEILDEMEVEFLGHYPFTLATGDVVDLPTYLGKVSLRGYEIEIETWFIPGDSLIGMEFLSSAGSILSLNFEAETVKLMR